MILKPWSELWRARNDPAPRERVTAGVRREPADHLEGGDRFFSFVRFESKASFARLNVVAMSCCRRRRRPSARLPCQPSTPRLPPSWVAAAMCDGEHDDLIVKLFESRWRREIEERAPSASPRGDGDMPEDVRPKC